jgi:predicted membrane channel-forming protein YqfA (hemolysin III family)
LPRFLLYTIYVLMVLIGLVAMYSLLNTGNPDSLLRPIIPNPAHDVYVAVISSVLVFILGFFVFFSRDQEGFQHLIELNADRIRSMRKRKKTDAQIADSILTAMGSSSGYRHNMARKKLIAYLAGFK